VTSPEPHATLRLAHAAPVRRLRGRRLTDWRARRLARRRRVGAGRAAGAADRCANATPRLQPAGRPASRCCATNGGVRRSGASQNQAGEQAPATKRRAHSDRQPARPVAELGVRARGLDHDAGTGRRSGPEGCTTTASVQTPLPAFSFPLIRLLEAPSTTGLTSTPKGVPLRGRLAERRDGGPSGLWTWHNRSTRPSASRSRHAAERQPKGPADSRGARCSIPVGSRKRSPSCVWRLA
jgi:hypothetical protein